MPMAPPAYGHAPSFVRHPSLTPAGAVSQPVYAKRKRLQNAEAEANDIEDVCFSRHPRRKRPSELELLEEQLRARMPVFLPISQG